MAHSCLEGDQEKWKRLVHRLVDPDRLAVALVGPQTLVLAPTVVADHVVSRIQNRLRAAVVLLQLDDLRLRIVALEAQDGYGFWAVDPMTLS